MKTPVTESSAESDRAPGRPLLALLLLFVVPLVLGALMAPQAVRLLEWISQYVNLGPHFTDPRFKRVLSRCVMLIAMALLYPAVRLSGIQHWSTLGWAAAPRGRWRPVAAWFAAGAISMAVAYLLSDLAGALYLNPRSTDLATTAAKWASRFVGAMLIGILEETFFRGYLFGMLRRRLHLVGAVASAAFLFAIVHFARPVEPAGLDPRHWAAGFQLLPHIADGIQPQYAAPMFVNLFLMGMLLCLLYDHFGMIYAVVGLHAGWVWAQGAGTYLFDRAEDGRLWELFGASETLSMTWAGTLMLAVFMAGALVLRACRSKR